MDGQRCRVRFRTETVTSGSLVEQARRKEILLPRYFVDVENAGLHVHLDAIGSELLGLNEARAHAEAVVGKIAGSMKLDGHKLDFTAFVNDADDQLVFTASFVMTAGVPVPKQEPGHADEVSL